MSNQIYANSVTKYSEQYTKVVIQMASVPSNFVTDITFEFRKIGSIVFVEILTDLQHAVSGTDVAWQSGLNKIPSQYIPMNQYTQSSLLFYVNGGGNRDIFQIIAQTDGNIVLVSKNSLYAQGTPLLSSPALSPITGIMGFTLSSFTYTTN